MNKLSALEILTRRIITIYVALLIVGSVFMGGYVFAVTRAEFDKKEEFKKRSQRGYTKISPTQGVTATGDTIRIRPLFQNQ